MHTKLWKENVKENPRYRWEDNINTDHEEMRWEDMGWIHLTQDETNGSSSGCWEFIY
jgi:hypothetical protein